MKNMEKFPLKDTFGSTKYNTIIYIGIIFIGIALFFGIIGGAAWLAHNLTEGLTQTFGLPPPR